LILGAHFEGTVSGAPNGTNVSTVMNLRSMSGGVLQIAQEQSMNIDDAIGSAPYGAVELRIL
jgi:hypothetical protein